MFICIFLLKPVHKQFGIWCLSNRISRAPVFYLITFCFLHKKSFSVVSELHVQIHRISIYFHVHLAERRRRRGVRKEQTQSINWRIYLLTTFSLERRTPILPKRTWKGEHCKEPSGCFTTMTSMQPDRVAGFRPRYSSLT